MNKNKTKRVLLPLFYVLLFGVVTTLGTMGFLPDTVRAISGDLSVGVSALNQPADGMKYIFSVRGNTSGGGGSFTAASVAASIPSDVTGVTWTCTATGGSSCGTIAANGSGNTINGAVTVADDEEVVITAIGTATNGSDTLATLSVTPGVGDSDSDPSNNNAQDGIAIDTPTQSSSLGTPPTVTGRTAPGASVQLYLDGSSSVAGTVIADSNGDFSTAWPGSLTCPGGAGSHSVQASVIKEFIVAGNAGSDRSIFFDTVSGARLAAATTLHPSFVAYTPTYKRVYTTDPAGSNLQVVDADPTSATFGTILATVTVSDLRHLKISPDGERMLAVAGTSTIIYDLSTVTPTVDHTFTAGTDLTNGPGTWSADGTKIYLSNNGSSPPEYLIPVFDASDYTLDVASSAALEAGIGDAGNPPYRFIQGEFWASPDGTRLFITTQNNSIHSIDLINNAYLGTITTTDTATSMSFDPTGTIAYAINNNDVPGSDFTGVGSVDVIDPLTGTTVTNSITGLPSGNNWGSTVSGRQMTVSGDGTRGYFPDGTVVDLENYTILPTGLDANTSVEWGGAIIGQAPTFTTNITNDFTFTCSSTPPPPTPAPAVSLQSTVYQGHNNGSGCPGAESISLVNPTKTPLPITYCFVVTNTGNTYLTSVEITDPSLGITQANLVLRSGSQPLAPAGTLVYYYQTTANGSLTSTATVSATPSDANGVPTGAALTVASDTTSVGYVFDPPFGVKTGEQLGSNIIRWTMAWINDSSTHANNVVVSDEPPAGTIYKGNLSCKGKGSTTTSSCKFEEPSTEHPRGRVVAVATIGPDQGATGDSPTNNELMLAFDVQVADGTAAGTAFNNQASLAWDADGNGSTDFTSLSGPTSKSPAPTTVTLAPNNTGFVIAIVSVLLATILVIAGVIVLKRRKANS